MAAFFAEQNIAFDVTDYLINVSKDLFCDSKKNKKIKNVQKKLQKHYKKWNNTYRNVKGHTNNSKINILNIIRWIYRYYS